MPEPKKKRHPDEGKVAYNLVSQKLMNEVTPQEGAAEVRREERDALGTAVRNDQFGRRTFPTATGAGYATPTYRRTEELQARLSRKKRSIGQPFFTDPGSGIIDFDQAPLPYVQASTTAADRTDRATYPATIDPQAFTGSERDPFTFSTTKDVERRELERKDRREIAAMKSNPVKTILSEIWRTLGRKPGRLKK
jgi:hypothetical protein